MNKARVGQWVLFGMMSGILAGCGSPQDDAEFVQEGLEIQTRTDTLLEATFRTGDTVIHMRAADNMVQDGSLALTIRINDATITSKQYWETGDFEVDGGNVLADAATLETLKELSKALKTQLNLTQGETDKLHERFLASDITHRSEAPLNHTFPARTYSNNLRGLGNEPIWCIHQSVGNHTWAEFDDSHSPCTGVPDRLNANDALVNGMKICSTNGRFMLEMQSDGNVVLRSGKNVSGNKGRNRWATNKTGSCWIKMQRDSNLVQYCGGQAVWASQTRNSGANPRLVVQNDGNLVVYTDNGAQWSTATHMLDGGGPANLTYLGQTSSGSAHWKAWVRIGGCWGYEKVGWPNGYAYHYDCMGRCGQGCGDPWPITHSNAFTQDCLEQDVCEWHNGKYGTLDSGSADCGDEYDEVYDDQSYIDTHSNVCDAGYNPLDCDRST